MRRAPVPVSGGGFPGRGRSSGCGCSTLIIVLFVIAVMAVVLYSAGPNIISSPGSADITRSTVNRVPLPAGSVNETDYYTDNLDWIGNRTKLLAGLKNFYQKTGVQPHLYITDTVNGSHNPSMSALDEFANGLYDELFTDEAHLLLVFFEYNERYMDRYVAGTQAKTVIDTEAADILLDYLDRYYYEDSLTDEEYFSKAFSDAAQRIMMVTSSPWIPILIVFGFVVLVTILFAWWRHAKDQKNLEAQRTEEVLKTPLEKFGDTEAEDLAKKYIDDDPKDPKDPKDPEDPKQG